MASYQYVYHMDGVSKTYPGGKKTFENIRLNFLPGVKIGVVGVNGAGKSTLLRIMAGIDKEFTGEGWVSEGARVGYLQQEPQLDATKTVRENVMEGVAPQKAILDRYNELAMNYSDENADEMTKSTNPDIRRLLGADGDLGKALGVDTKWVVNVVKGVGNYGEMFDRNIGPLGIPRGINNLWNNGGLHYPPPIR